MAASLNAQTKELLEPLRSLAVSNVNKSTSGAQADENYHRIAGLPIARQILEQEIEIIDPKLVLCGSEDVFGTLREIMAPQATSGDDSGRLFLDARGRCYVRLYHPAARVATEQKTRDLVMALGECSPT